MDFMQSGSRFILRIDKGEEVVETVKKFCSEHGIKLGTVKGLGAANKVAIGLFETRTKEYHSHTFEGDFEIAPLFGIITEKDGEIYLHLHANIAGQDHKSYAGHLNSAVVSATCEVVIEQFEGSAGREFSDDIGLNLLKF